MTYGAPPVPWPVEAVRDIGLHDETVRYLTDVGLTRAEGPFLWLAPPPSGELPVLLDVARGAFPTRGDRALASTMRVLGRDTSRNPVLLLRDGRVMLFDVEAREIEDVNGSLAQLAACNDAARAWVAEPRGDVLAELARIDPVTRDDESFWRVRLRAPRDGQRPRARQSSWRRLLGR